MLKFLSRSLMMLLMLILLTGCNLPQATPQNSNAVFTAAAETVQAQLTQDSLLFPQVTTPAPSVPETATPPAPPTAPLPPTATASATPLCDLAQFVADVTVPDGTEVLPEQTFSKTWRLRNLGTCTWTSSYQVIFDNGELMGGPATQPLAGNVAPGQQVDIIIAFKAPTTPGAYRGYWRLRNAAGVLMPIASGYQGTSFFVDIKVVAPTFTPSVTPTPSETATPTSTPGP